MPKPQTADEKRQESAKSLVKLYGEIVKPRKLDNSLAQAPKNIVKRLKGGQTEAELAYAIRQYAATFEPGSDPKYRFSVGNFFGRAAVYSSFVPGGDKDVSVTATENRYAPPEPMGGV